MESYNIKKLNLFNGRKMYISFLVSYKNLDEKRIKYFNIRAVNDLTL